MFNNQTTKMQLFSIVTLVEQALSYVESLNYLKKLEKSMFTSSQKHPLKILLPLY
jgi:hypothetical protein